MLDALYEIIQQLKQVNTTLFEIKDRMQPQELSSDKPQKSLKDVLGEVSNDMSEARKNVLLQEKQYQPLIETLQDLFLGYLFYVSPQVYSPNDFTPMRTLFIKKDGDKTVNSEIRVEHLFYPDIHSFGNEEMIEYEKNVSDVIIKINEFLNKSNF